MEAAQRWQRILASALDGATVEPGSGNSRPDLLIRTRDGRSIAIDVKWAGEGWPQDVRTAAADVEGDWPENVVLLARDLSPGAIEWLRARGANWADEAGQVRILGPDGLIVIREIAQRRRTEPASRAFSWSKSSLAIAEAILTRVDQPLRANGLATETGWSVAQVAKVLNAFDQNGWTAKRGTARGPGARRELTDAAALLAAWSAGVAGAPRSVRLAHRATRDLTSHLLDELVPALDRSTTWALSGWAALELAAPFATTTPTLHVYVTDGDFAGPLTNAFEASGLREVEEGGRATFWAADSRLFKLAWRSRGVPIVSAPRLYADLSSFGARGQDAADHVRSQLIDPLHAGRTRDESEDAPNG